MTHEITEPSTIAGHSRFLEMLNPPQRRAVEQTEGALLVLAGAGSGKTRVIAHRIAYLIACKGIVPGQILAVTFTNKAAGEMRNRVIDLLGERGRGVWIGTFHSACVRMLRQHGERLGYAKSFQIYDSADQLAVIKEGMKELQLDPERYRPSAILGRISWAKNHLITPAAFQETAGFGVERSASRVYPWYEERLRRGQAMDFDDLLLNAVRLFEEHPAVLESYLEQLRYLLIDEFQDTNPVQYRWVRLLTTRHNNLCVVGDDDQSIYRFRGAEVGNILRFERDFPGATVILLEQNYRSTQTILNAAMAVVERNPSRHAKRLWTERSAGVPITRCRAADDEAEADYVAGTIQSLRRSLPAARLPDGQGQAGAGMAYRDFALLYRTNAQSRSLEEGLRRRGIPYQIIGGLRFYERKEIKDLLAYLRAIVNPSDSVNLMRILNVPARGIGTTTAQRIQQAAAAWRTSPYEAIGRLIGPASDEHGELALSTAPRKALAQFWETLEALRRRHERVTAKPHAGGLAPLLEELLRRTGYQEWLKQEFGPAAEARIENIQELFSAIEEFEEHGDRFASTEESAASGPDAPEDRSLAAFLDRVALASDVDELASDDASGGAVLLMTLHSAKGLEFPVVFLAGMEEGLFPHFRSLTEPAEMEEERRLCYVGMTRAKSHLYVMHTESRRLYGSVQWNAPSRFLNEIPAELCEMVTHGVSAEAEPPSRDIHERHAGAAAEHRSDMRAKTDTRTGMGGTGGEESSPPDLIVGIRVRHPVWGAGTVKLSEGRGDRQKVVVHFASVGMKKLLVQQARLERA